MTTEAGSQIAILSGGQTAERDISLSTGREVGRACEALGHAVRHIDPADDVVRALIDDPPDVVFNALHGPHGEDGCVQGLLETLGLPYTHSGVLASALAMDKARARHVFAAAGLEIAHGGIFSRQDVARAHVMAPPYVIKPPGQGSSFGVFIVDEDALSPPAALSDSDWSHGEEILVEEFIPGKELTVTVMNERALAVTEIIILRKYYDYSAKYTPEGSHHVLPAEMAQAVYRRTLEAARQAHLALGCRGVTRSDFRYDSSRDRLVILETNTQPGMTPMSLVPEQARHVGMSFEELVEWILKDASCPR